MYKHIASHFIPGIAEVLVVERVTHGRFSLRGPEKLWMTNPCRTLQYISYLGICSGLTFLSIPFKILSSCSSLFWSCRSKILFCTSSCAECFWFIMSICWASWYEVDEPTWWHGLTSCLLRFFGSGSLNFSSGGVSNIPLVANSLFEAIVRWHVLVGDKFLVQSITWR